MAEWATVFCSSRHGRVNDYRWARGQCVLENSKRDSDRFCRNWSLVRRLRVRASCRRHAARRIHSGRLAESGDAFGPSATCLGAVESRMARDCLQGGCKLDRGDRHDDINFRVLAAAFTDAVPLERLPVRSEHERSSLNARDMRGRLSGPGWKRDRRMVRFWRWFWRRHPQPTHYYFSKDYSQFRHWLKSWKRLKKDPLND